MDVCEDNSYVSDPMAQLDRGFGNSLDMYQALGPGAGGHLPYLQGSRIVERNEGKF